MTAEVYELPAQIDDKYRDPVTEHWLGQWAVPFTLSEVYVTMIDFAASKKLNNRAGADVISESVESIAAMMGDPTYIVPPIVVAASKSKGFYTVVDGNLIRDAA